MLQAATYLVERAVALISWTFFCKVRYLDVLVLWLTTTHWVLVVAVIMASHFVFLCV